MAPSWLFLLPPAAQGQREEALMSPASERGQGHPPAAFGCCRTHILFRYHSIIPCRWAPGWESKVGILHGTVSALPEGWTLPRAAVPWPPGSSGAAGSNQALGRVAKCWHQQAISPVPWGKGDPDVCERGAGKVDISSQAS